MASSAVSDPYSKIHIIPFFIYSSYCPNTVYIKYVILGKIHDKRVRETVENDNSAWVIGKFSLSVLQNGSCVCLMFFRLLKLLPV